MKDYSQNTPSMAPASGLCEGINSGSRSAAQIIHDVAAACGINPQVLIVLLQKEQSLVTDDWPWKIQYNNATGFACPDTAPCDPNYAGFFYQVYYAARQFKVYKAYPNDYNYRAKRNNTIYWHPDLSRCGSSTVYIENQATAALYIYTPYRPNSAALKNLYGTGDSCSSYGNRNFWRMFNEWFGSSIQRYRISSHIIDGTTDSSGEQGVVGFSLNSKPTNSVTFELKVSSPSNARVAGTTSVTITPDTWNQPARNIVRISGKYNSALEGTFHYSLVPDSKSSSIDKRFSGLTAPNTQLLQLQADSQPVYRLYSTDTKKHFFTASRERVKDLEAQGFRNEGAKFSYCKAGEQAMIRVVKNDDRRIVAFGSSEYQNYLKASYKTESLDFATSRRAYIPVYWLYDPTLGRSLYTTSESERTSATGFEDKGLAFYVCSADQAPVYRLYRKSNNAHFYSTSESERNHAANGIGYTYEGVGYYACATGSPVYRLYRKSNDAHFYTTSTKERDSIVASGQYRNEGAQFNACSTDTGSPVYRLYRKSNDTHFYTTSTSERNSLVQAGFRDEGERFTAR